MGNQGPRVIEHAAQHDGERDTERRQGDRGDTRAREYLRQENAEQRKPGYAEGRRGEAGRDRQQDAAAQPARQLPQAPVEVHQRTFSSELAARSASLSVRGSSTSTVRCSVGRGVAVMMLTPFGAWKRCQAPCGTTTAVPALSSWVSTLSSTMMSTVVEPAMICTSSSPLGWRSQAARPENFAL